MTAVAAIVAGARLTAEMLEGVAPDAVIKPSDESVTSSTTLQNDNDLWLALPASSSWIVACNLAYVGGTTGSSDLKWEWTLPAGASAVGSYVSYYFSGASLVTSMGSSVNGNSYVSATNGANSLPVLMLLSVTMGGTQGNLQLEWAQNTSSGTATTVKAGSWLGAWQVA